MDRRTGGRWLATLTLGIVTLAAVSGSSAPRAVGFEESAAGIPSGVAGVDPVGAVPVLDDEGTARQADDAPSRPAMADLGSIEPEWLRGLEWRSIGPAVTGGRIDDVEAVSEDPSTIYVGTASGGLWRTRNNGMSWEPLFDDQATSSIGDIALAPSDPRVVWVGTGEPNNRQSSTWGHGVYRSTDGGESWRHLGLEETRHIGRVVVHPEDPDRAWVAALGHLWGPNPERGLYRTTDGGESWERVLFLDEDTGVVDVQMDAGDPDLLFAAAYQRRRRTWGFVGGGEGSGLYRSRDGGETWTELTGAEAGHGLPGGNLGRIGLATAPGRPDVVMAVVQHREAGGVYRSEDGGDGWERVNELDPRPMYYSKIRVDPTDHERVYLLAVEGYTSSNGGRDFEELPIRSTYDVGVHSDLHALWIDPRDPEHLILGGDGGLYDSYDRGRTWRKINNFAIAQFYGIGVDMQDPYYVYGGMQDNHSWRGPSATRRWAGILNADWQQIDFGDGMYTRPDPRDPEIVYVDSQNGGIIRFDARTGDRKDIRPRPVAFDRLDATADDVEPGDSDVEFRFDWTAPILISPHDNRTIYFGGNRLFISRDRGESWTATRDLTSGVDRDELPIMGEVPDEETLSRHDGTASYAEITTIAESPVRGGVLWVGTDDGFVQVSRDGGTTWANVSEAVVEAGVPAGTYVSRVVADVEDPGRAYASFDGHRDDDLSAYVLETRDFGRSWRAIDGGLPEEPVNVVRQHPGNPELLFAGTEHGVYVSFDRGGHWVSLRSNLPTVPVDDMVVHPRDDDLVLGTHGRGIWILDDVGPLEELSLDGHRAVRAFSVRPATFFYPWKDTSYRAQAAYAAPNPPRGALIRYWVEPRHAEMLARSSASSPADEADETADAGGSDVAEVDPAPEGGESTPSAAGTAQSGNGPSSDEEAEAPVSIRVIDRHGDPVRELRGPAKPGFNRVVWDLRAAPGEAEADRTPPPGPFVRPGAYEIRITVPGHRRPDGDALAEEGMEGARRGSEGVPERRRATTRVQVKADPRLPLTDEGLDRRFRFLLSLRDQRTRAHRVTRVATRILELTEARRATLQGEDGEASDGGERGEETAGAGGPPGREGGGTGEEAGKTAASASELPEGLERALESVEAQARGIVDVLDSGSGSLRRRLASLVRELEGGGVTQGSLKPPTRAQRGRRDQLAEGVDEQVRKLAKLIDGKLSVLNVELRSVGLEPIEIELPSDPSGAR